MGKRIDVWKVQLVKERSNIYDIENKRITSPQTAEKIIRLILKPETLTNEHFGILTLNTKNDVIGVHIVSQGTVNSSIVHPRDVFQHAILNNATSIIAFHNHPSGDCTPSPEDIDVTNRLKEAGIIIGIDLLDHIILGDDKYCSLKEKGYF